MPKYIRMMGDEPANWAMPIACCFCSIVSIMSVSAFMYILLVDGIPAVDNISVSIDALNDQLNELQTQLEQLHVDFQTLFNMTKKYG